LVARLDEKLAAPALEEAKKHLTEIKALVASRKGI
jgi:hypothetical protein